MTRDEIIIELRKRADRLKAMGATSLYVFGSRARGDNRPDSDLDLFMDYNPGEKVPSLFAIMAFEDDLKSSIGIRPELTTRDSLHYYVRDRIVAEAVQVF